MQQQKTTYVYTHIHQRQWQQPPQKNERKKEKRKGINFNLLRNGSSELKYERTGIVSTTITFAHINLNLIREYKPHIHEAIVQKLAHDMVNWNNHQALGTRLQMIDVKTK